MVFAPLEIGAIIQMHSLKNSKPNSRSNTMNRYRFATTVLLVILAAGTLGNLDAYGIKMFRINSNARDFTMDLVVTTTNANAEAIKLRTGDFDVIFQGQAGRPILLGKTSVSEHIMPGKTGNQPGQSDLAMTVQIGPQNPANFQKILDAVNVIGNPKSDLIIIIRGKAEVGMKLPRGWVYEQGKRFEVELEWTPALQREWVLK
jgi:hypothetical protein